MVPSVLPWILVTCGQALVQCQVYARAACLTSPEQCAGASDPTRVVGVEATSLPALKLVLVAFHGWLPD